MHGKVLIIDPIATNGIILKVKFSAACYTVTQTLTLAEAIAAIGSSRPDIVITANELHDRTALHLVAQMREQPKAQNIPIIAITCHCWKLGLMNVAVSLLIVQVGTSSVLFAGAPSRFPCVVEGGELSPANGASQCVARGGLLFPQVSAFQPVSLQSCSA